jgi:hypothetical protein
VSCRAALRKRSLAEDGFALLDVVIAIVVLMIVLFPVAYLLSTTSKIATSNQSRLTAQSLAQSWLEQQRTGAEQSSSSPPTLSVAGTQSRPLWNSASGTETVGTITYDIYIGGGWCAYAGNGLAWGNGQATTTTAGNPPPIAFFFAVKVSWGPDAAKPNAASLAQDDGSVVEYSSVQSQPGWTFGGESVVTLTSTNSITGSICPLALSGVA